MQSSAATSQLPYGRISFFFFLILLVLTWGFYHTYLIFFPSFTGFKPVQHFHGAVMMSWMALLIAQPLLIRAGKISLHRLIGKLSYVLAPLVVVSIFLITRFAYYRPDAGINHQQKVGELALQGIDIVQFGMFYCLAIVNRHNTYDHMRYMIGTAIMMIGPGLSRALGVYYHIPFAASISDIFYVETTLAAAFLVSDILRKKSYKANLIILSAFIVHALFWEFRMYQPWQSIGEFIAGNLF